MIERKNDRVELITPTDSKETSLFDLSSSGIGCFYGKAKEKGSYVKVKINDLSFRAKVAYCIKRKDNYRLGLQFWNILPERQKSLTDMVEKYSRGIPLSCEIIEEDPASIKKGPSKSKKAK